MNIDKRLLSQTKKSRISLFLTIILGFLGGFLIIFQAKYLSAVINHVFLLKSSFDDVQGYMLVLIFIFIARAFLLWGKEITAKNVAVKIKTGLREDLYQKVIDGGPSFTSGERTGELISVFSEGIEALDAYFSQYLPQLVLAILIPITFLCFIFPKDVLSGVILLITAPLIPLFMALIGSIAESLTKKQWKTLSRMSAHFLDVLQGLTTLKILGRSKDQISIIAQISERFRQRTMNVLRVAFLSALTLEMLATISTAIIAVEIGLRLLYGKIAFEQALFILLLTPDFYLPLRMLGTRFHAGMAGVTAAGRIFSILEHKVKSTNVVNTTQSLTLPFEIKFRKVSFHYPYSRGVLQHIDLEILPNMRVALVGPSGGGKSTIIQLLLRFIEQSDGEILINGIPLKDIPVDIWREHIAWVPQNPYLFNASIKENIHIANPNATDKEIILAAKKAQVHEFIQSLPAGYDTLIGERGTRLSGGQGQRISLARAFLKNAPLLILDEPSANLDPSLEKEIKDSIDHLTHGKSVLMIAHRLNSVITSDIIYVLNKGRIIQQGSHTDLLEKKGLYQKLVSTYIGACIRIPPEENNTRRTIQHKKTRVVPRKKDKVSIKKHQNIEIQSKQKINKLTILQQLIRFLVPYKKWILASVLFGFLTVGSSVGLMGTSAYIISAAALQPSIADLQVAIVGVRFFGISRGVFRYLERYISHQVTFKLLAGVRVWFYSALEPLAPARLIGMRSGDLLSRITADIEILENFYVRALSPPLVALFIMILTTCILMDYSIYLSLIIGIFFSLAGIGVPIIIHRQSRGIGSTLLEIRADLNNALVDGIQGVSELLIFGGGQKITKKILSLSKKLGNQQRKMAGVTGTQLALVNLFSNLCMWVVLYLGVLMVISRNMNGVYLAVITLIALSSFEAVNPLPEAARTLESNIKAGRRLFEIVDAVPAVIDSPKPIPFPRRYDLQLQDVHFAYPPININGENNQLGSRQEVLKGISFSLQQGKRIAIVGPSGAGKSTIINLLLRFWEFQEGSINLGGVDIRQLSQDKIREKISIVSQNTYLFNATIKDNIRISNPEASQAEIEKSANRAEIDEFILSLQDGYDTWIGEQGLLISGGERQRIAIARAILKDSPILILDEALTNLDSITENGILNSLIKFMEDRTTLMVTHRLVGMDKMDEILVLNNGSIIECGHHDTLLQEGGFYHQMWDLQQQILQED